VPDLGVDNGHEGDPSPEPPPQARCPRPVPPAFQTPARSLPQSPPSSPCEAARYATKSRAAAHGGGFVSSEPNYVAAPATTANSTLKSAGEEPHRNAMVFQCLVENMNIAAADGKVTRGITLELVKELGGLMVP